VRVVHFDIVTETGAVFGAIGIVIGTVSLIHTKVVRPVFRGLKRLGQMADQFLGDPNADPPVPSLPIQVRALRAEQVRQGQQLGEHVAEYHQRPATSNGHQTQPSPRARGGR
jgi:hypothetical protein